MALNPSIYEYIPSSKILSGLGAVGVALQNYPAVEIFVQGVLKGIIPLNRWSLGMMQALSFTTGGLCSGLVNFWMNVELLEGFFKRINSNEEYQYLRLNNWEKFQYFSGVFVFVVTGVLYGLMAFTFAMEGPLATLSISAGLFVAGIMTIQELETWFASYDKKEAEVDGVLSLMQQLGQYVGQMIAVGNVAALSLLFTLSLAQSLMALQMAAVPALAIGFAVAFSFGAFTEYYFYHFYLANFCKNFGTNLNRMAALHNAYIGFLCVCTNAFVNGALTYAGIELLMGLVITANLACPPLAAIIALASGCSFFAASASLMLGMDFWVRQNEVKPTAALASNHFSGSIGKSSMGIFSPSNISSMRCGEEFFHQEMSI